jgi:diacylglycerol O-acyltransferase / wax synthase
VIAGFTAPPVWSRAPRVPHKESKVLQSPESGPSPSGVPALGSRSIDAGCLRTMLQRVSADDLMSLAARRHPPPLQVGAVLIFDVRGGLDIGSLRAILQQRIAAVPRLRQRLEKVPLGCGRPVWVDDPGFNIDDHLTVIEEQPETDDADLLDLAASLLTKPLPENRPLWNAAFVPALTDGRAALILVMHHVVGDGLAGLAVLRGLVDGSPAPRLATFPQARLSRAALATDAWSDRIRSLRRLPKALGRLFAAFGELGPSMAQRAQPSSLNKSTGPTRSLSTVVVEVSRVHELAHSHGATVNDLVLTAVTGALHELLTERGEQLDSLVVSVPFASRTRTESDQLGNRSGVIPVKLPTGGGFSDRLTAVSAIMRAAKQQERGASTAVLGPLFRLLARLGGYQYFIDHQSFVHTFVSNLRGPDAPINLLGCRVLEVVPLSVATGNITVSFTALSYENRLVITITSDPKTCPDVDRLCIALRSQLAGC